MSDKIRKLKERAARYTSKGKYEDALGELKKCIRIDPKDLSVRQKLAETYVRMGQNHEAIVEYQGVAGSYAADGLLLKAIAINKIILGLDPNHTETQTALASLYTERRGGLGGGGGGGGGRVAMPKAMSAALDSARKRSASEIRGTPSTSIPAGKPKTAPPTPPPAEEEALDAEAQIVEVIDENPAATSGAQLQTSVNDIMAFAAQASSGLNVVEEGDDLDDIELEVDIVDDLPGDEELILDDDDDGDVLEILEVEIDTNELPDIPLFSELDPGAFIALTEKMEIRHVSEGEAVVKEGDPGNSMFIIIQGKLKVERTTEEGDLMTLAQLTDGTFFGEMALISEAPRTASVVALEDAMLFEISRDLVAEIVKLHPSVDAVMKRFHRNRLLTNLMRTSPIFAPFSPADKRSLMEKFKSRGVDGGRVLITRDQPGDGLYVLLSGRCEVVTKDDAGNDVVLAELRDGDVFGEMSMLWKKLTVASVRTVSPCIVLRLPKDDFDMLIMTHPQILEVLATMSSRRENENAQRITRGQSLMV